MLLAEAQAALATYDFTLARTVLERILAEYPTSGAAPRASALLQDIRIVGQPAPEIVASSWFQGTYAYQDAPVTLLVFFETWCPHCNREMPKTVAMAKQWGGKGLGVVAFTKVNRSATDDAVRAFIKEHHVSFPVGKEQNGSLSEAYGVTGIPAAALVKGGVVVWQGHPARITPELLAKYLE